MAASVPDLVVRTSGAEYIGEPFPEPGARVRLRPDGGPPWLVVEFGVEGVLVPSWPIRLWEVTEVEPAPEAEQISTRATRAVAFTVVRELDAWRVFGPQGQSVAWLLDCLALLTRDDVLALADALRGEPAESNERLTDRRFRRPGRSYIGLDGPSQTALELAHQAVLRAARDRDPSALAFDPVDGVDVLANPDWTNAAQAVARAVIGFVEAPADAALLILAWKSRFGDPPAVARGDE